MEYKTITTKAAGTFRRIILWAGIVACAVSCRDEELMPGAGTEGLIAFRVREGNPLVTTRAASGDGRDSTLASLSGSVPLLVGGDTIEMSVSTERNREPIFAERAKALTRGVPFGNDGDGKAVTGFQVTAFRDNNETYFENRKVAVKNGIGLTGQHWPAWDLSFCAYAWSMKSAGSLVTGLEFEKTGDGLSGSFSYSLPGPKEGGEETRNDALEEPDLVFAMAPGMKRGDGPVDLLFHHALSAVVFKAGTIGAENVRLKSIVLENFYGGGGCKMTEAKIESSNDYNGRQDVKFEWTPTGEQTHAYVQQLGDQQAVTGDRFGKEVEKETGECTFMMIPQEIGDDSKIVLTFSLGDSEEEYTLSKNLKDIAALKPAGSETAKLLPDTRYTFTIGLTGDIDIEVDDKVEGKTKSDVTIQNTGISTGYIRAAVVGWWEDESGSVTAPWREKEDGSFTGLPGENWKKGTDGFWYYTKPVKHYGYTDPLFTSYTLNENAVKSHSSQKLVLDVVAQIVLADKRKEAGWPTEFGQ